MTSSNNDNKTVSVKELHSFLDVKTDFTDWCKRMFEYGFEENLDFVILLKNKEKAISKSNPVDYALTLDCAKELAMVEANQTVFQQNTL